MLLRLFRATPDMLVRFTIHVIRGDIFPWWYLRYPINYATVQQLEIIYF